MSKLVLAVPNFPGKEKLIAKASRLALKVSKHSPEICVATGIVAGVGATVLACRATLRVGEVIDFHNETMAKINKLVSYAEDGNPVKGYSVEEGQKEKWIFTIQTICKIGKLYSPAIIAGAFSVGMILGGHRILKSRNAALSLAYTGLQKAYDEYRKRVREVVGEEKENDIFKGVREVVTEETKENGKVVKKKSKRARRTCIALRKDI